MQRKSSKFSKLTPAKHFCNHFFYVFIRRFREKKEGGDKKKGGRSRSKGSFKRPTANTGKRLGKQKGGRKRR